MGGSGLSVSNEFGQLFFQRLELVGFGKGKSSEHVVEHVGHIEIEQISF